MAPRPTCKTCPYYDPDATTTIYPESTSGKWVSAAQLSPVTVHGKCRRELRDQPQRDPGEWCGDHPGMWGWIVAHFTEPTTTSEVPA